MPNIENLSVLTAITVLLGYMIKQIVPKLMRKLDERDKRIELLTDTFVSTTTKFVEVQNHKTTEMTRALVELTDVNKEIVELLKK